MWCHLLVAKFATNANGGIWWPILQLMQVAPFVDQICIGVLFSWKDNSSFRCYTLGPLCLWQCFFYLMHIYFCVHVLCMGPEDPWPSSISYSSYALNCRKKLDCSAAQKRLELMHFHFSPNRSLALKKSLLKIPKQKPGPGC